MTKLTKKARQVRCISCGKWCASARFKNRPHGSNVFDWARGGTIHAQCEEMEWEKSRREQHKRWEAKHKNPDGSCKIPPICE